MRFLINFTLSIFITIIVFIAMTIMYKKTVIYHGIYMGLSVMLSVPLLSGIIAGFTVKKLNFSSYKLLFPSNSILAGLFVWLFWIAAFPMFIYAWLSVVQKQATLRISS